MKQTKCDICGKKDKIIIRYPDCLDRCVKCAAKYEGENHWMDKPFFQEPATTIYCGHVMEVLKHLPDESVQMSMTSPPYWGLRNYAGGTDIIWGGDENCKHKWGDVSFNPVNKKNPSRGPNSNTGAPTKAANKSVRDKQPVGNLCSLCNAWRGQLGLEPTPELYVEHLMLIFREVKRVLRKDGSFYLNIGDTYASGKGTCLNPGGGKNSLGKTRKEAGAYPLNRGNLSTLKKSGLQPKCMVCIPERVMIAMIEDGWILRNKIIWHKPNAMPSSVKDRYATTWEYLYFFTKARKYYFDLDAVRAPHKTLSLERYQRGVNLDRPAISKSAEVGAMQQYKRSPQWFQDLFPPNQDYKGNFDGLFGHGPQSQSFNLRVRDVKRGKGGATAQSGELRASEKEIEEYEYPEKYHGSSHHGRAGMANLTKHDQAVGRTGNVCYTDPLHTRDYSPKGKNPGDYWKLTTQPSSICACPKCFTVFPRRTKICPKCKAKGITGHFAPFPEKLCRKPILASTKVGDIVLDFMAGTGTIGVEARKLGRRVILIDCVKGYCAMSKHRIMRTKYQPELGCH